MIYNSKSNKLIITQKDSYFKSSNMDDMYNHTFKPPTILWYKGKEESVKSSKEKKKKKKGCTTIKN